MGNSRKSKEEDDNYAQLELLQKAGKIKNLKRWPEFKLYSNKGILLGVYTADAEYVLVWNLGDIPAGTLVAEEYKGSKDMWAYKRRDYKVKLKHAVADYPEYTFIENIKGKRSKPRFIFKKG